MPNEAKVIINELDLSIAFEAEIKGIAAVSIRTLRGPFGKPDTIINSWNQFLRLFGDEVPGLDGPTLAKRALERGARLRVNRVGHYTDVTDASTLDAVKASIDETPTAFAQYEATKVFDLVPKYAGADYNNLNVYIDPASNGNANYFNLLIEYEGQEFMNELYENIQIVGAPTALTSDYLSEVISDSKLVDVTYNDVSALTVPIRPADGIWDYELGSDGTAVADTDYVGDTAGKTGFFSFDQYGDFIEIAALDSQAAAVHNGGATYADGRKDCVYFGHIDLAQTLADDIITARQALTVDTRFAYLVAGGLIITDRFTGLPKNISALGDVVGVAANVDADLGPWRSFAGPNNGQVFNALGVVTNFGAKSSTQDLDNLANAQVNTVINRDGKIMVWGNFSSQLANSRKSFLNVVKLIIYLERTLRPILESYLEEPNDTGTWRNIFNQVRPILDDLAGPDKRALNDYEWKGDQDKNDFSQLEVNNEPDVLNGKYVIQLFLKELVSLQIIELNIISSPSGVSFENVVI